MPTAARLMSQTFSRHILAAFWQIGKARVPAQIAHSSNMVRLSWQDPEAIAPGPRQCVAAVTRLGERVPKVVVISGQYGDRPGQGTWRL